MSKEDEKAARSIRDSTLASLEAKRESRVKQIQERAQAEIREVNIRYSADPERIRAKYALLDKSKAERSEKRIARMQSRADKRAADARRPKRYSIGEEIFNSVSHGVGAGLSVAAIVLLIVRAVEYAPAGFLPRTVTGFTIFGVTLLIMYLMSTLYHALTPYDVKQVFAIFDHSSIYLLIAGTYTPFCLTALHGVIGWTLFGIVWALAGLGITFYAIFGSKMRRLSAITYVLMGWLVIFTIGPMSRVVSPICIKFLIWGGVVYTIGALFYAMKRIKWTHSVFHLFVLVGSICHFFSVLYSIPLKA